MEDPLLSPSPSPTTHTSPSISTISVRLASFLILLSAALYANYEASRNFDITVLNSVSVSNKSPPACRFDLLFVSNGRASRIILESSHRIEKILYPNSLYPKKLVHHVLLQLATHNLPEPVTVIPGSEPGSFVISLSPSLLLEREARREVESAVRRAMARVWIWDGDGTAPAELMDAMVEGLSHPGTGQDPIGVRGRSWAQLNREILKGGKRSNLSTSAAGLRQVM